MAKFFSDYDKLQIVSLHLNGSPVTDVCRKFGISQETFSHWEQRFSELAQFMMNQQNIRPEMPSVPRVLHTEEETAP